MAAYFNTIIYSALIAAGAVVAIFIFDVFSWFWVRSLKSKFKITNAKLKLFSPLKNISSLLENFRTSLDEKLNLARKDNDVNILSNGSLKLSGRSLNLRIHFNFADDINKSLDLLNEWKSFLQKSVNFNAATVHYIHPRETLISFGYPSPQSHDYENSLHFLTLSKDFLDATILSNDMFSFRFNSRLTDEESHLIGAITSNNESLCMFSNSIISANEASKSAHPQVLFFKSPESCLKKYIYKKNEEDDYISILGYFDQEGKKSEFDTKQMMREAALKASTLKSNGHNLPLEIHEIQTETILADKYFVKIYGQILGELESQEIMDGIKKHELPEDLEVSEDEVRWINWKDLIRKIKSAA